jgi:SAM-dependent methyltransferase
MSAYTGYIRLLRSCRLIEYRPMETIAAISRYYARGGEADRLNVGRGQLEFLRTRDVLRRLLPTRPARVLDVGGGAGMHAGWLASDGYQVRLVDPMPLHVQHAGASAGVDAVLGDARRLDEPDAAYQATLLLGPLYHLPDRQDRVTALREAARDCTRRDRRRGDDQPVRRAVRHSRPGPLSRIGRTPDH